MIIGSSMDDDFNSMEMLSSVETVNGSSSSSISVPNYRTQRSRLVFDSLSESDYGDYVCSSTNEISKTRIKLNINEHRVTVSEPKFILNESLRQLKRLMTMKSKKTGKYKQRRNNN